MKKIGFILSGLAMCAFLLLAKPARADAEPELRSMEATAYCYDGLTYSGAPVRRGICAGRKEWIGKCAAVYMQEEDGSIGEFVGYYEVLDTGSDERLINGSAIDIYLPDEDTCLEWGRKKVYIKLIDAEG